MQQGLNRCSSVVELDCCSCHTLPRPLQIVAVDSELDSGLATALQRQRCYVWPTNESTTVLNL